MQIAILIQSFLIFILLVWLCFFSVYVLVALYRISNHFGIELPLMKEYKQRQEEERKQEEADEQYTQVLKELADENIVGGNNNDTYMGEYNELDVPDQLHQTEAEPESIMQLLEFGLPDEEIAELLAQLEH